MNVTIQTQTTASIAVMSAFRGINVLSIISSTVVIFLFAKTKELRGISGVFMINQAIADTLLSVSTLTLQLLGIQHVTPVAVLLRLAVYTFNGSISHSLMALSYTLYLAICKSSSFKKKLTRRRVAIFLIASWCFNVSLQSLYYVVPNFYIAGPTGVKINYQRNNLWLMVLWLGNIIILPFSSAMFSFLKIRHFMRMSGIAPIGRSNEKKLHLAQMVHIITILFLVTYVPVVVVISIDVNSRGVRSAAAVFNYCYPIVKIFVYFRFYRPLWVTAKRILCCCCRSAIVSVDVSVVTTENTNHMPRVETVDTSV